MSANSKIEWTHHTYNPWWGCAKVSPGCDHCYAERDAKRHASSRILWGVDAERREFSEKHWNEPLKWNAHAAKAGQRHRVFCASMADVFDKNAPAGARERLWGLIKATPNLDWLILTKRIGNAASMLPADWDDGYENVWLGISIVNQEEADRDIPKLLRTPAYLRWLSMEPLLGPVDILRYLNARGVHCQDVCPDTRYVNDEEVSTYVANLETIPLCPRCGESASWTGYDPCIDWVVAGGESGPMSRPMHPQWPLDIRDQCVSADKPFVFKQWGEWEAAELGPPPGLKPAEADRYHLVARSGHTGIVAQLVGAEWMRRVGKKASGRLLTGWLHDDYPDFHVSHLPDDRGTSGG
jgi:protein gp37